MDQVGYFELASVLFEEIERIPRVVKIIRVILRGWHFGDPDSGQLQRRDGRFGYDAQTIWSYSIHSGED